MNDPNSSTASTLRDLVVEIEDMAQVETEGEEDAGE